MSNRLPMLTLNYDANGRAELLTDNGIDLTKELPIRSIFIEAHAQEFPEIALSVVALSHVRAKLTKIILEDFDGNVEIITLRERTEKT